MKAIVSQRVGHDPLGELLCYEPWLRERFLQHSLDMVENLLFHFRTIVTLIERFFFSLISIGARGYRWLRRRRPTARRRPTNRRRLRRRWPDPRRCSLPAKAKVRVL